MKTLRYSIILAVLALTLTSCREKESILPDTLPGYLDFYFLQMSFKDADGNDLVMPLAEEYYISDKTSVIYRGEVNPEHYSLDLITFSGGLDEKPVFFASKYDAQHKLLKTGQDGRYIGEGTWYLGSTLVCGSAVTRQSLQETIKYKFKCPMVFGDDYFHEIITWWEEDIQQGEYTRYPKCFKATIDGKEVAPAKGLIYFKQTDSPFNAYFLDIKL